MQAAVYLGSAEQRVERQHTHAHHRFVLRQILHDAVIAVTVNVLLGLVAARYVVVVAVRLRVRCIDRWVKYTSKESY
jgi:hypothetical protein